MVPGNHTGHGLLVGHRPAEPHRHLLADPEPAASRSLVDLDRSRPPAEQIAVLPDPGKLLPRRPAELADQDQSERLALAVVPPLVDVEAEAPGRARLVVVIAIGHDGSQPG